MIYVTGCVHTLCQEKITRFKNDNSSYRKSGISYLRCSQIVVTNTTFDFKLNFNVNDFIDGIFISFDNDVIKWKTKNTIQSE